MFWQISLPQPSQTGEKRVRGCDKQMRTNFDKPLSAAAAVVAPSSSSFNHLHSLKSQPFLKCVRLGGQHYFLSAGLNLQNLEHPFLKKHLSTRCSHQVWQGPCIGPPSSELSNGSRECVPKHCKRLWLFFPLAWLWKAVTSDSGTGETTSDEQQQVLQSALSLVSGCWSAHCLLSSGDGSTPFRAGHYWWPPWGSHVQCTVWQVCTLYLGAAMFRVWQRAQSGGGGLKQPAKPLLLDFPSRLPPIEPVGWDAGKMGSKMRRRGLYSRSHVPLLSLPSG